MSLHRRVATLEKKRLAAAAADDRILGIIDYCDSQGFPEWDGVYRKGQQVIGVIGGIRISPEDWPEACRVQQKRLMDELAEYAAQLDSEGTSNEKHTSPNETGEAPLKSGQKRARYLFTVENGVETQLDRLTGERIQIGKV